MSYRETYIPVSSLFRQIKNLPEDTSGFKEPEDYGPDTEVLENHNRMRAAEHGHYADPWTGNTRTYDPKGNYGCGECNMDEKPGKDATCLLIERDEPINAKA